MKIIKVKMKIIIKISITNGQWVEDGFEEYERKPRVFGQVLSPVLLPPTSKPPPSQTTGNILHRS